MLWEFRAMGGLADKLIRAKVSLGENNNVFFLPGNRVLTAKN